MEGGGAGESVDLGGDGGGGGGGGERERETLARTAAGRRQREADAPTTASELPESDPPEGSVSVLAVAAATLAVVSHVLHSTGHPPLRRLPVIGSSQSAAVYLWETGR